MVSQFVVLTDSDFQTLQKFIQVPSFLFNENEVIQINKAASIIHEGQDSLKELFRSSLPYNEDKVLKWDTGCHGVIDVISKGVMYHDQFYLLGEIHKVSVGDDKLHKVSRTSYAMEVMLEIAQKIMNIDTIDDIYSFILENAHKAVKKSKLCTIMVVKDGKTHVVAQSGYNDNVYNIVLDVKQTFLYQDTEGRMDRIVNIPNLAKYCDSYYDNNCIDEGPRLLKSTMSAPLYVDGKLFGMINFDDVEVNAFDGDDESLLNLVRKNIEIALSNFMMYHKLEHFANYDQLTGLHNRISLENSFENYIKYGDSLYVVMIDLNGLKKVNDNYGHIYGDKYLKQFAQAFNEMRTEDEFIARNGGDEFVGLLLASSMDEVTERLISVQEKLQNNPIDADGENIICSFSYGVVVNTSGAKLHDLLREADVLMYNYKRSIKKCDCEK